MFSIMLINTMSISVELIGQDEEHNIEEPVTFETIETITNPVVEPFIEPATETVEPAIVPIKKPTGHRNKYPNTKQQTDKASCPACAKVVPLNNLGYTHQSCVKQPLN